MCISYLEKVWSSLHDYLKKTSCCCAARKKQKFLIEFPPSKVKKLLPFESKNAFSPATEDSAINGMVPASREEPIGREEEKELQKE